MWKKILTMSLVPVMVLSFTACVGEPSPEVDPEVSPPVVDHEAPPPEDDLKAPPPEDTLITPPPETNFEADVTRGRVPASVTFTNNSANADEFLWDFGDGTSMTTITLDEPATHEYTEAGTQTVTLTAIKKGDSAETDTATLTITVNHGLLARVGLNTEAVRLGLGQTLTFTAEAVDTYGNPIPEALLEWEAVEEAGTVAADGTFTAGMQAGTFPQVVVATATLDNHSATAAASVTVAFIPDLNLDAVIREALGKIPVQEITVEELFNLRDALTASERGITDLTGIERCPNLSGLDLSMNQIIDISPLANLACISPATLRQIGFR